MSSEHRLHPYSVLFAFVTQVRIFIVPGILIYFGIGQRDNDWWQPWMMLFVLPAAGLAVLRYLTYRFRYDENELVIRTGLLFRKERHIPYARIQNIDAEQNLLHRFLNVVEIKIETGGGESAEATMSVLPMSALATMRARVFAERTAVGADQAAAGISPQSAAADTRPPLLALNLRELLLCGFIENRGAVLIAAAAGVVWELGFFDRMVFGRTTLNRGVLRNLARGLFPDLTFSWLGVAMTLGGIVGVLILIRLFSMAWSVVRLYGFRLTLVNEDARAEFGLLTRVALTIPLRRVQALTVRESPLHRFFARVAVRADTAGGRGDEQNKTSEREYLAPILPADALEAFARRIIDVGVTDVAWQPCDPRAMRRELKHWLIPAGVMCLVLAVVVRWYALAAVPVALAWAVLGARQTIAHLGWATTADAVLFKRGWLWRRVVIVRFAKIQAVTRIETPFDRRWQMARIHVDTAGAREGNVISIPYVARTDADALYAQLSREAASRQFTW